MEMEIDSMKEIRVNIIGNLFPDQLYYIIQFLKFGFLFSLCSVLVILSICAELQSLGNWDRLMHEVQPL